MGKGFRCLSYALVGIALMLVTAQTALAHRDPTASTSTGVSISLTAFRADQTTPIGGGAINECETIYYQATLAPAAGAAAIEGGELRIFLPGDLVGTPFTGIPCLGGTFNDPNSTTVGQCLNSQPSFTSGMVQYQSSFAAGTCTGTQNLTVNVVYTGGIAHNGVTDQTGVAAQSPFQSPVVCCTDDGLVCNGVFHCDPTVLADGHLGSCVQPGPVVCTSDNNVCNGPEACSETSTPPGLCVSGPNAGDSFTCPDTDSNLCTTAGCDGAGACSQTHVTKTCADDNNVCNGPETCDTTSGNCVSGPNAGDSFTCPDTDSNLCTTAGCDGAGACSQTHVTKTCADDGNVCNGPETCDTTSGNCASGPNAGDSTVCTDDTPGTCPFAGCVAGICVQDHTPCPSDEICRTPGFWGTHGGIEKLGPNITQAVLNQTGPILICGHLISTTDLTNLSAIEAICVSPKGDSTLQLARQLTAAALNCGLTKSTGCEGGGQTPGDVCSGVSINDTFTACNLVCADPTSTQSEISACIGAIDCFNGGGTTFDPATDICSGDSGCHDRPVDAGCINFPNPGPASSPKLCNDARKDDCTVLCAVACSSTTPCPPSP